MAADIQPRESGTTLPPWGGKDCLAGLGAALVAVLTLISIASWLADSPRTATIPAAHALAGIGLTLLFDVALVGIAAVLTIGRFGGGLASLGWRTRPIRMWAPTAAACFAAAWITLGAYWLLTALLGLDPFVPQSNAPTDLFNQPLTLIPSVALIIVAAPLAEETFFRGFLFRGFLRRLGFAGAATVSGVVFALAHASPSLIIPYTVIGVIFAYGYWRSGTLVSNTAAHLCFNLTSVVITLASLGRG